MAGFPGGGREEQRRGSRKCPGESEKGEPPPRPRCHARSLDIPLCAEGRDLPRSFTPGREVSGGLGSAQSLTVHSGGGRRTPNRGREVPVRLPEPLSSRNHY